MTEQSQVTLEEEERRRKNAPENEVASDVSGKTKHVAQRKRMPRREHAFDIANMVVVALAS